MYGVNRRQIDRDLACLKSRPNLLHSHLLACQPEPTGARCYHRTIAPIQNLRGRRCLFPCPAAASPFARPDDLARSSRIVHSGPGPPAQAASQLETKPAMLCSSAFNSRSFARTAARCSRARSRASRQERSGSWASDTSERTCSIAKVAYAVMSFGGFLGMGQSYHPLPWDVLDYDEGRGGYVVDLDKERLTNAPHYDETNSPNWSSPEYGRRIDEYYGVTRSKL